MSSSSIKQAAAERVERASAELIALSRRLHGHPELAFQERQSSQWCAEALSAAGFHVDLGVGGLPTALRASAGEGSLRVAFCAEYDALPGIGHACGHNVICAASVGAAIGSAAVADTMGLSVVVLGTPAEELYGLVDIPTGISGPGKTVLLQAGAFDDVHFAMMVHPAPVDIAVAATRALTRARATFLVAGEAASPILTPREELLSADQAVATCQVAAHELQGRAPAGCSIHLVRSLGCWGLTAHGRRAASVDFGVWGESFEDVEAIADELDSCAHAAADATGTSVDVERFEPYAPMRHDPDLAASYRVNAVARGRSFPDLGSLSDNLGFCTDMGNVSSRLPAVHPLIGVDTTALNHQAEFAPACAAPGGDRAVVDGAVALAWTAIDAALVPELRDRLLSASGTDP